MRFSRAVLCASSAALYILTASCQRISEINGVKFLSPYRDQAISNTTGLITAKGPNGIWIRSTAPDADDRSSESIYVFDRNVGSNLTVGDVIALDGRVVEFRSTPDHLFLTEIASPRNVRKISSGNKVEPLVIGKGGLDPPTEQYSSLDNGDVFGLPNNVSQISNVNPELEPDMYGLDFWASLNGELVTVRKPTAISKPNNFRDTWVVGDWRATGRNRRGGLTVTDRGTSSCLDHMFNPSSVRFIFFLPFAYLDLDANPEAILIGTPLDGTRNPTDTKLGDGLEDITGVVTYAFGFYRILPQSAIKVTRPVKAAAERTKLVAGDDCSSLTIGSYNVENLSPNSSHLPRVADHIVDYLNTPTLVFLQEVQDNNGPTDDTSAWPPFSHWRAPKPPVEASLTLDSRGCERDPVPPRRRDPQAVLRRLRLCRRRSRRRPGRRAARREHPSRVPVQPGRAAPAQSAAGVEHGSQRGAAGPGAQVQSGSHRPGERCGVELEQKTSGGGVGDDRRSQQVLHRQRPLCEQGWQLVLARGCPAAGERCCPGSAVASRSHGGRTAPPPPSLLPSASNRALGVFR